ncbi:uncharacterized protein [Ptychodera flava]|uniref:uncharacterized protein n=1 Tax=Ptychodera flava TaxID=63121 RepID=UPI00396A242C
MVTIPLPTDITVSNITDDGAEFSWTIPEDEDLVGSIVLQYRTDENGTWQNITVTPPDNSVELADLEPNTNYEVRLVVKAHDGNHTRISPVTSFTTRTTVPLPVDVKFSNVTEDSVRVTWTIPEDEDLIGNIIVQYKMDSDNEWENVTVVPPINTAQISDLESNSDYNIRLIIVAQNGQDFRITPTSSVKTLAEFQLPDDITIVNKTTNQATVTWTLPLGSSVHSSIVEYRQTGMESWTTSGELGNSTTAFTMVGLSANTEYSVRLVSRNSDGSRVETTDEIVFVTYAIPLPTDITVSNITDDGAEFSWTIPEDEDLVGSIVLQYRTDENGTWQNITVTPPDNSVELTDLEPNTNYEVRLVVKTQDGNHTRISPVTSFTTRTTVPLPVDVKFSNVTEDSVRVTWTIPEDEDLIGNIIVQYKMDSDNEWENVTVVPPINTAQISDLEPNSDYNIRLIIVAQNGQDFRITPTSSVKTLAEFLLPDDITIVNKTTNQATVTWTLPLGSSVHSSIVEYRQTGMESWTTSGELGNSTTAFTMVGLSANTEYSVRLVSRNSDGSRVETTDEIVFNDENGTWQNITVTPPDNSVELADLEPNTNYEVRLVVKAHDGNHTRISPVTSFTTRTTVPLPVDVKFSNVTGDSVRVTWTIPEDEDLIGNIIVQYKMDSDDEWENVTVVQPINTAQISDLEPNSDYNVRLIIVAQNGQDFRITPTFSVKTLAEFLLPDDITIVNKTTNQATVTWTLPLGSPVHSSIVEYRQTGMESWTTSGELDNSTTAFTMVGLSANTEYSVRLMSRNSDGSRVETTDEILFVTYAVPLPTDLTVSNITNDGAEISWTISEDEELADVIVLQYRADDNGTWRNITVTPPDKSAELTDLEPNANYEVRLVVESKDGNHSRISPVTSFTTRTTLSLPYDVRVQNITTNKATVTWTMDPDSTIPKFVLQYKSEAGDEPWINVTLASIAVTDFTLNDLSANTEYSVRFLGTSDNGSFSESTHPIMFSTEAVPLPVDVKFSNVTEDSVRISWTIPEDEDLIGNIIVQYKMDSDNEWENVTVVPPINRALISDLEPNSDYNIRLMIVAHSGEDSRITPTSSVKTLAEFLLPEDITIVNKTTNQATVSWALPLGSSVHSSIVEYRQTGMESWTASGELDNSTTAFTMVGLSANTEYSVRLVSRNSDGSRVETTDEIVFATYAVPLPTDITVSNITDNGAEFSWTIPEDEDLVGVIALQLRTGDNGTWQNITVTPPANSVELTDLEPNTNYEVRLVVESKDGNHTRISPVTSFTTQTNVPVAQNIEVVDIRTNQATVMWLIDNITVLDGVMVQFKPSGSIGDWRNASSVLLPFTSSFTITDLADNSTYAVRLLSIHKDGTIGVSDKVSFTTSEGVPLPLDVEISEITDDSATVSWTYPSNSDLIGSVIVQYKTGTDDKWQNMTVVPPITSVKLSDLEASTEYNVRVMVVAPNGADTSITPQFSLTTLTGVPLPRSVEVTDIKSTKATVSWLIPQNDDIVGYITVNYQIRGQEKWLNVSVTPPTDSVVLEDLSPDETYLLYLVVVSTSGEDSRTTQPIFFQTTSALPTPSDVMVDDVTENSARISWTPPDNIDQIGQVVFQYRKADGQWQNVSLTPDTKTFALSGLDPASSYTFRFDIISKDGNDRTLTPEYAFTTRAEVLLPENIAIVNKTTNQATVTWTLPLGSSVHSSIVEYRQTGMESWTTSGELDNSTTAFTMVGLSANTEYSVRLVSRNSDGSRVETTDEIVFVTYAVPLPTDITVKDITDNSAEFSWTIPEDEELVDVIVLQYRADENGTWQNITVTPPDNSVELTDLEPNTNYEVRLVVESKDGNHTRISPVTSFTTQTNVPVPHDVEIVDIRSNQATVIWLIDNITVLDGVMVQFKPSGSIGDWRNASSVLLPFTSSFTITDLADNGTYTVRLLSIHKDGRTRFSEEVSFTTSEEVPLPTDVQISEITDDGATVSWTYPSNSDLIDTVIVQYESDTDDEWQNITVVPPITSAKLSGLEPSTEYNVRLVVIAPNGVDTRVTPQFSLTTLTDVPIAENVEVIDVTANQATVTWSIDDITALNVVLVQFKPKESIDDWKNASASLLPFITSFTITDLLQNRNYSVRLLSIHSDGTTTFSDEVVFTTSEEIPVPSDVQISEITDNGATVSWIYPSNSDLIDTVIVQYKSDTDDEWQNITVVPPITSAKLSGLEPSTEYNVRLMVVAPNGVETRVTPQFSMTTLTDVPIAENVDVVDVTANQATVTWSIDDITALDVVLVQFKPKESIDDWKNASSSLLPFISSFTITDLLENRNYSVRLLSIHSDGTTAFSDEVVFTTSEEVPLPTDVQISEITDDGATVSWTYPSNSDLIDTVIVQYKSDTDDEWQNNTVVPPITSAKLSGLEPRTEYNVRLVVVALNGVDTRFTPQFSITTLTDVPIAENVEVVDVTANQATVTWSIDDITALDVVLVQFKTKESIDDWKNASASLLPFITSFTITDLLENRNYSVRLLSIHSDGTTALSDEVVFTTSEEIPVPTDVQISEITDDGATVSWTYPSNSDLIGTVIVQYKSDTDDKWQNMTVVPPITSAKLSGLEPRTEYNVRLMVVAPNGVDTRFTPQFSMTTVTDVPIAENVKVVDVTANQATVTWSIDDVTALDVVLVQFKPKESIDDWKNASSSLLPFISSFTITDLLENRNYSVRLLSIHSDGTTAFSDEVVFTTSEEIPVPTDVQISEITDNGATVSWTYPSNSDPIGTVIVQYKSDTDDKWQNMTVVPPITSAKLGGLEPSTEYNVRVMVVAKNGIDTGITPEVTLTTLTDVPVAENLKVVNVTANKATVTWSIDDITVLNGIVVQFKLRDTADDWSNASSLLSPSVSSFTITDLIENRTYSARVLSIHTDETTAFSDEVLFTSTESVPLPIDVEISEIRDDSATVSWTYPSNSDLIGSVIVQYKTGTDDKWQNMTVVPPITSVKLSDLEASTEYNVRVMVVAPNGADTSITPQFALTTLTKALPSATNILVEEISVTSTKITWELSDTESRVQSIVVQYKLEQDGATWNNGSVLPYTARNVALYMLTPNSTYMVRILVQGNDGTSSESEIVTFQTPAVPMPKGIEVKTRPFSATLSWTFESDDSNVGAIVYYKESESTGDWIKSSYVAAPDGSFVIENLSPDTDYVYKLAVVAGTAGIYHETEEATFTTEEMLLPRNVTMVNVTQDSAEVTWILDADSNVGSLVVQHREDRERVARDIVEVAWLNSTVLSPSITSYKLVNLTAETNYVVRHYVVTRGGTFEAVTEPTSLSTSAPPPLPLPSVIEVSDVGPGGSTIEWSMPDTTGVKSVVVQYRPTDSGDDDWVDAAVLPPSSGTYVLTGLSSGTDYEIRLQVTGEDGRTVESTPQEFQTENVPVAENLKVLNVTANKATVTWSIEDITVLNGIVVQFKLRDTTDDWSNASSLLSPSVSSFTITDLIENRTYSARVLSIHTDETTAFSDEVVFTSTEGVPLPLDVEISEITDDSATVSWTYPSNSDLIGSVIVQYKTGTDDKWQNMTVVPPITSVKLSDLEASTQYNVRVMVVAPNGADTSITPQFSLTTLTDVPVAENLKVLNVTANKATVTWSIEDITVLNGIVVQFKLRDTTDDWSNASSLLSPSVSSFTITDLIENRTYSARVLSIHTDETTAFSDEVVFTSTEGVPLPLDVEISEITDDSATVSWTYPSNSDLIGSVIVQYKTGTDDKWQNMTVVPPITSVKLSDLEASTEYNVRVMVVAPNGADTSITPQFSLTTLTDVPVAENLKVLNVTANKATVTWSIEDITVLNGIVVQFKLRDTTDDWSNASSLLSPSVSSFTITDLIENRTYSARVLSIHTDETTAFSDEVVFTSTEGVPLPLDVEISDITDDSATVSWTYPSNSDLIGSVIVQYKTGTDDKWQNMTVVPPITSVKLSDLEASTEYNIRVMAVAPNGADTSITPQFALTTLTDVPVAENLKVVNVTANKATVTWSIEDITVLNGIVVQFKLRDTADDWSNASSLLSPSVSSFTITDLIENRTYSARVLSIHTDETTAFSDEVVFTSTEGVPLPLDVEISEITDDSATVSWTYPSNSDLIGSVIVQYKTGTDDKWQNMTVVPPITSVKLSDLEASTEYNVRVMVVAPNGADTSITPQFSLTTLTDVPVAGNLKVVNVTANKATVNWSIDDITVLNGIVVQFKLRDTADDWSNASSLLSPSVSSFTITDLIENRTYSARVLSIHTDETTAFSDEVVFTSTEGVPLPLDVEISEITDDSATVSWTYPSNSDLIGSVIVQYKTGTDDKWQNMTVVPPITSVKLSDLEASTQYNVRVMVVAPNGADTSITPQFSLTTLTDVPVAENLKVVNVTANKATVTWSIDDITVLNGILVQFKLRDTADDWSNASSLLSPSVSSFTITDLIENRAYSARVLSIHTDETTAFSDEVVFTSTEGVPLPLDVEISEITDDSATVSWTYPSNSDLIGSVIVQYKTGTDDKWQNMTVVPPITSVKLSDLEASTQYNVRVMVVAPNGADTSITPQFSLTTLTDVPVAENLKVVNVTANKATVTWSIDDITVLNGIVVQFKLRDTADDWSNASSLLSPSVSSFTITDLIENRTYSARVLSIHTDETTAFSDEVVFTLTEGVPLPIDVQISEITDNSATVSWTYPSNSDLIGSVIVQYKTGTDDKWQNMTVVPPITSVKLSDLEASTEYNVRVMVVAPNGADTSITPQFSLTTLTDVPVAENLKVVNVTANKATVTWSIDDITVLNGILVQFKLRDTADDWSNASSLLSPSVSSFTITDLIENRTYSARVLSIHTDETTAFSDEVVFTSTEGVPLPLDVEISEITDNSATVSWTYPSNSDLIGSVIVQYKTGTDDKWQNMTVVPPITSVKLSDLEASTEYNVRVMVVAPNGADTSITPQFSLTTLTDVPVAENLKVVNVTANKATVTWSIDDITVLNGILVQFKLRDTADDWSNASSLLSPSVSSFTITDLIENRTYSARVLSIHTDETTAFSDEVVFTSTEGVPLPLDVEISEITDDSATVSWTYPSNSDLIGSVIVQYKAGTDDKWQNMTVVPPITSVKLSDLEASTEYNVRVMVVAPNGADTSITPQFSLTTLTDVQVAQNVEIINVTASQATVTWSIDDITVLNGVVVQFKPKDSTDDWKNASSSLLPLIASFTITDLYENQTYLVRVLSVHTDETTAFSEEVVFMTTEGIPLPVDVKISDITDDGATISWTFPSNSDQIGTVIVQYKADSDDLWQNVTVAPPVTSTTLTGLQPSKGYSVRLMVEAANGVDRKVTSTTKFDTLQALPKAINIRVEEISVTSAKITWELSDTESRVQSIVVQYKLEQDGATWNNGSVLPYTARNDAFYMLTPNSTYMVRILVQGNDGTSSDSEIVTFQTSAVPMPKDIEVKTRPFSATLSWTFETDDSNVGAIVYHKESESTGDWIKSSYVAAPDGSFVIENLSPNTVYVYKLAVVAGTAGIYHETEEATFTTEAMLLPRNVTMVNVTQDSAEVTWILDADSNVGSLVVQHREDRERVARDIVEVIWLNSTVLGPSVTSYKLVNLTAATNYVVRHYVVSGDGAFEAVTEPTSLSTSAAPPLALPSVIDVSDVGPGGATIEWSMPDTTGVESVVVQYRPTDSKDDDWVDAAVLPPSSGTYVLTGLSSGTDYEIRLQVTGEDGRTTESTRKEFQTESLPLPYDVKVIDIADTRATILWQLDVDLNVAGTLVQYSYDGDVWLNSSFVSVGNNSVVLSQLLEGTPYTFRLVVVATDQGTAVSTFYNFMTTGALSPFNIRVNDITSSSVTILWDLNTNLTTDGAVVQYRTSNETWHNSSYVAMPNTSVALIGLYPKAKYIFRIIYFHKYSDDVTVTPAYFFETTALVPPLPFYLRVIAIHDTSATVIWYFNDTYGIAGCFIRYKTANDKTANEPWSLTSFLPVGTESVNLLHLEPDSQYVVMMEVVGVDGSTSFTPFELFTTEETGGGVAAPLLGGMDWWFYLIVAIVIVVFILLLCCILCMVVCLRKKKYTGYSTDKEALTMEEAIKADIPSGVETVYPLTDEIVESYDPVVSIEQTKSHWWEIPRDKLTLIKVLAAGKFGDEFWEGQVESYGEVADVGVKKSQDDDDNTARGLLHQELDVLSRVSKHTHIVNLVGACTVNGPFIIVVDDSENIRLDVWLRNLDRLHDPVRQSSLGFNLSLQVLPQLYDFAIDISKGMGHLASLKCVHHHLGARNVIISANLVARVTDYALPLPDEDRYASMPRESQSRDDIRWMSHESIFYKTYTGKSNVWSFGVILWELISIGRVPYEGTRLEDLRAAIRAGQRLENPSAALDELFALMSKCWATEPKYRPLFSELTDRLSILLKSIDLQRETTRKYTKESLSVLANEYTNWNDYQVTLLEDLILSNIEKSHPQSRLMAVQYAAFVFPPNHVASKYVLLLASGDEVKIVRNAALDALRTQSNRADSNKSDEKANAFPDFVSLVTFISLRMKDRMAAKTTTEDRISTKSIKVRGPLGTHSLPFSATAYEKMTIYLRMCLAYDSRANPNVTTAEEMRLQGPLLSKRVNTLLDEAGDSTTEGPITLYLGMLRQHVSAVGGAASMYRILELVAVAPERLAPEFVTRFGRLKVFLHSDNLETRSYAAELYGILLQYVDKNIVLTAIQEITQDLNHEYLEVQHGSILALGHIIGKYLHKRRRLASLENIEYIGDSSNEDIIFTEAVKAIVMKLDSVIVMLVEAACIALGEIGRNGPLPLKDGGEGTEKTIEDIWELKEEDGRELTKLSVVQTLMSKVLSEDDSADVKAKAAEAVAFQTIGDPHFPHRKVVIQGLLESAAVRVQPRTQHISLHFAIGDSLVTAIQGPYSPHGGDNWRVRMEDRGSREPYGEDLVWPLTLLVDRYINDVPADHTEEYMDDEFDIAENFLAMGTMRESVCVWLLVLTANFRTQTAIETRLMTIQQAVTQMVNYWEETNVIVELSPTIQHRLLTSLKLIKPAVSSINMGKMISVRLTQQKQYHSEVRIQISRENSLVENEPSVEVVTHTPQHAEPETERQIESELSSEPSHEIDVVEQGRSESENEAEEEQPGAEQESHVTEVRMTTDDEETLESFFGRDMSIVRTVTTHRSTTVEHETEEISFETFLGSEMNIEVSSSEKSSEETRPEDTPLQNLHPDQDQYTSTSFDSDTDEEDEVTQF